MWNKLTDVKAWFLHSETIFLNRIEAFSGLVVAGVASMDWSPLWGLFGTGTAFNAKELYGMSAFLVIRGIVGELARRRNAVVTASGKLV